MFIFAVELGDGALAGYLDVDKKGDVSLEVPIGTSEVWEKGDLACLLQFGLSIASWVGNRLL